MRHFTEVYQDAYDLTWGWQCATCYAAVVDAGSLVAAEEAADIHATEAAA